MLVTDAFKEIAKQHEEVSEKGNLKGIAQVSDRLQALLCEAPEDVAILYSVATTFLQLGSYGVAANLFRTVVGMAPELARVWNNLGSALKAMNLDEEALACFKKALSLDESADHYCNLMTLHVNSGDPVPGMEIARKGLALDPSHGRLRWNYALVLLEQGLWKEGFEQYESGLGSLDRPVRYFSNDLEAIPMWEGEKGRVVVYGEQGMGDEIMWASCIADLKKDVKVVFECHPRMVKLMERSFKVPCYGTRKSKYCNWAEKEHLDYKIAIGSLFKKYRSDGNFPKKPYLKPHPGLVAKYRKRMEALGPGPYVGIGWHGGHASTRADFRSFKISDFMPILEQGGTFISVQYTEGSGEKIGRFNAEHDVEVHHWPEVVEARDSKGKESLGFNYDHTVALAAALDLVIVPNTSIVHVCGALGAQCWTLTPPQPAWRYQLEGTEMPFYGDWVKQYRTGMDEVVEAYSCFLK